MSICIQKGAGDKERKLKRCSRTALGSRALLLGISGCRDAEKHHVQRGTPQGRTSLGKTSLQKHEQLRNPLIPLMENRLLLAHYRQTHPLQHQSVHSSLNFTEVSSSSVISCFSGCIAHPSVQLQAPHRTQYVARTRRAPAMFWPFRRSARAKPKRPRTAWGRWGRWAVVIGLSAAGLRTTNDGPRTV